MNFPHKELAQFDRSDVVEEKVSADAILAHAIARQSLSFSARSFVSHKNGVAGTALESRSGWMEDRIQYFAEGFVGESADAKADRFVRGHFRPDLALGCSGLEVREGKSA